MASPGRMPTKTSRSPLFVARVVPNLDAPEIKDAVAANYLQSMGMLFETPLPAAQRQALEAPQQPQKAEQIPAYPDEGPGQYDPAEDPDEPEGGEWGDEGAASGALGEPQSTEDDICADCHRKIVSPPGKNWKVSDIVAYSKRIYGRALCQVCQDKARSAQRGGR